MKNARIRFLLGMTVLVATYGCKEAPNAPTPAATLFMADLADPVGDALPDPRVAVRPDLRSTSIQVTSDGLMNVSVRFAAGTFTQATQIELVADVDENATTGNAYLGLGLEYVVKMGALAQSGGADVERFVGGNQFALVQTIPATITTDGIDVSIPLALIGNDDGRLGFRVVCASQLSDGNVSLVLDILPDRTLPPGVVQ